MTTIQKTRRTPAEAARARLRPQPKTEPQPAATAASALPVSATPIIVKTVVEELREQIAFNEQRDTEQRRRIDALEGRVAQLSIAVVTLAPDDLKHIHQKLVAQMKDVWTSYQDKIKS